MFVLSAFVYPALLAALDYLAIVLASLNLASTDLGAIDEVFGAIMQASDQEYTDEEPEETIEAVLTAGDGLRVELLTKDED